MKIQSSFNFTVRRAGAALMAGVMVLPGTLVLGPVTVGIATGVVAFLAAEPAQATGSIRREARREVRGTARRTTRRTTRRVARRTGRRVAALGAGASLVHIGGLPYYYWGGRYYQRSGTVYVEVIVED